MADDLGVGDIVTFSGFIANRDLLTNRLDSTDLFILPSRTEGLPRAMIEAMARAVLCIGTSIGGIPELLQADEMVQPGDDVSLAELMIEVVSNPARMAAMSARNLGKARHYHHDILQTRRREFYSSVRSQTEKWIESGRKR